MIDTHKLVIVGFGNLGQAIVPLLQEAFPAWPVTAVEQHADAARIRLAGQLGIEFIQCCMTQDNAEDVLGLLIGPGDILLNLAHAVSSCALIRIAQQAGALYLDTGIEPWEYAFGAESETSNYALRERVLAMKRECVGRSTALVAHGANPGFVSVLVKVALLDMARIAWPERAHFIEPATRADWAQLAANLDIRVIQISERDTQRARHLPNTHDAFDNTWSVDGFIAECRQEAELGWGTHEPALPEAAREHRDGCRAAIQLASAGQDTLVKTWTPLAGEIAACVLTHNESISIADYLTLGDSAAPHYRPTVYYAYRPMDAAIESLARLEDGARISQQRVLKDELSDGIDELGVLLMSGNGTSLWLGSALSIERTRALAPLNNATSLQVVSSIIGGIKWMIDHPRAGVVESEEIDHAALFDFISHYWAPIQRRYTQWRPDPARHALAFDEFRLDGTLTQVLSAHESGSLLCV